MTTKHHKEIHNPPTAAQSTDARLERQQPLALTLPGAVHVIGLGGVGSWIALALGLAGVKKLFFWDHDEVSQSNLNRLPFKLSDIGTNKAEAMRNLLESMIEDTEITVIAERWTAARAMDVGYGGSGLSGTTGVWFVACTDTLQSRRDIFAHSEASDISYIEGSANGEFGGCVGSPAMQSTALETQPGYASVPVWIGPCLASAMLVCAHILHGALPGDSNYRLGWNPENDRIEAQFEHFDTEAEAKTA